MIDLSEVRVLVVDDSAFNRQTIARLLEEIPGVEVIGKARSGEQALEMLASLKPDLITLDLDMPTMNGFSFLKIVMATQPTPVLVVSGHVGRDTMLKALELGAVDFIAKPTKQASKSLPEIRGALVAKVKQIRAGRPQVELPALPSPQEERGPSSDAPRPRRVVLVGASTGGPPVVGELLKRIPPDHPDAFVIVQHMPPRFTATFAERLDRASGLAVKEAQHMHALRAGEAWVCPGGKCLDFTLEGRLRVCEPGLDDRYVPSIDRTFLSAAERVEGEVVAVVLTGMGDDGALGIRRLKESGAKVYAQRRSSATIEGMPLAAIEGGGAKELSVRAILQIFLQE